MVERNDNESDFFVEYREHSIVPSFDPLKEIIKRQFIDKTMFLNLEPHLVEWMVVRYKHANREINTNELNELTRKFSVGHDELFDNSLFVSSIKLITEKIGSVA